ncbi:MAG: DMT family transporter [Verrucomicrobia bacterium]|nr:DMT family transporter [Verrucomicrobiota bacterium]
MNWVVLSILSALFLGVYDLIKKAGVRENAVPPVLFFSVLAGALVWLPFLCWSMVSPDSFPSALFLVKPMTWKEHGLILAKSTLVSASWVFNYFAVKHLPVSVASPIRATAPLWTIMIAVSLFGERPVVMQWLGIAIILCGFYAFSFVGKLEGIHFHRDRWVGFMMIATLLGALSALYDKYLLQTRAMEAATVQCWFSIYLTAVLGPFCALWRMGKIGKSTFHWRWSIPMTGITLLAADFFYFVAISQQDALISVVSPLRRCAVLITFFGGIIAYREKNMRPKLICILIILMGIFVLKWSS